MSPSRPAALPRLAAVGRSSAERERSSADPSERRGLRARLRASIPEKIVVLLGLSIGICVPYFLLQRADAFPLYAPPVTRLDRWIGFEPGWVWPYQSVALLVPLAVLLANRRDQLMRYAKGLALLCVPCFAAFLLFPVEGPRPEIVPDHSVYRLLVSYDGAANSLPSLHAGLALYSVLFGYRVLRDDLFRRERAACLLVGSIWVAVILYSTLATKQHWAADLPLGLLIAYCAHGIAWRSQAAFRCAGGSPLAGL